MSAKTGLHLLPARFVGYASLLRAPRQHFESSVLQLYRGASYADRIDFTRPAGDPGLVGPAAVGWRVMRNPAAVFMGGISAVLLEFLLPGVRAGVWEHSYFRQDPNARLKRTGLAAMVTTYGATEQAEWVGARVQHLHGSVKGQAADGTAYDAMDPVLQTWVAVTAAFGFLQAYRRYVNPRLSRAEMDHYWSDSAKISRIYGDYPTPGTAAEARAYMEGMRPRLENSPATQEFLAVMRNAPAFSRLTLPVQRMLIDAAIDLLPAWAQQQTGLEAGRARRRAQRPMVKAVVSATDWLVRDGPAFEACRRVGVSPGKIRG